MSEECLTDGWSDGTGKVEASDRRSRACVIDITNKKQFTRSMFIAWRYHWCYQVQSFLPQVEENLFMSLRHCKPKTVKTQEVFWSNSINSDTAGRSVYWYRNQWTYRLTPHSCHHKNHVILQAPASVTSFTLHKNTVKSLRQWIGYYQSSNQVEPEIIRNLVARWLLLFCSAARYSARN